MFERLKSDNVIGACMGIALHGAVLYGLWSYRLIPTPQQAMTLFVDFIKPQPLPKKKEPTPPPPPPKKVKLVKPQPVASPPQPILVSNAPVVFPMEPVAPPPPPEPVQEPVMEAPPPAPELIAVAPELPAPVVLSGDLAVACPQRSPPEYPAMSRRLGEQGRVVLRVELDETGRVVAARVKETSGFRRLDDAGLVAVKTWHCNAPTRDGQAVKAIALQPFNFVLEGRR